MNKALDEQCARAMGLEKKVSINGGPKIRYAWPTPESYSLDPPPYSTSHAVAVSLEDAIERRKLVPEYMAALERITGADTLTYTGRFALIRATPEQRALAFVAAMGTP